MPKASQRITSAAKRRKHPVKRRFPSLSGYRRWLEYVDAYQDYMDHDRESQRLAAYLWCASHGHTLEVSTLTDEISHLPASTPHKVGRSGRPNCQPLSQPVEAPRHLYILDVDDLLDFTEADIFAAWDFRAQTCGSIEAAAELYALYRVLNGADDFYAGSTAYLEHSDVVAIFGTAKGGAEAAIQVDGSLTDVSNDLDIPIESEPATGLTLEDVRKLSSAELKVAWGNRPDSFASLEAAAETLATLRAVTSKEFALPNYRRLMDHALIRDLEDSLPLESAQAPAPSPTVELELLRIDRRTVRTQVSVVRPGQGNFRATMMARYGAQCVFTGCKIDTLLEAAHIIPYRGDQSDDELNGLLLRVDIHRLFDAHLISINPLTLTVELASSLSDETYQVLKGKRLFAFSPKPRDLFLEAHYELFRDECRSSTTGQVK